MFLWKFTLREIRNRPGRATLTLLSIVIGVAAMVAVDIGTTTTHLAYQNMYEGMAGRAAFEVVAEDGSFFPEDIVQRIGQVPGVKTAVPSVQKVSILWFKEAKVSLLVMGIDPKQDEAVRDYKLYEGEYFGKDSKPYDALLETGFAHGLGVKVGDEVKLGTTRGGLSGSVKDFRIIGLLSPQGAANFNQGGVIFLPLPAAEYFFAKEGAGYINQVSVVLAGSADEKAVQPKIAGILPAGLTVRSPMARAHFGQGNHAIRRKRPEHGLLADDRSRAVHDLQHLPDERRRAPPAIGRAAGGRRHPPANHADVAARRAGDGLRGHRPRLRCWDWPGPISSPTP